jgi:hypothetical protein
MYNTAFADFLFIKKETIKQQKMDTRSKTYALKPSCEDKILLTVKQDYKTALGNA